ncbi:ARM repeat-containing protein [Violaceomyces palustris]|uniref:ARM repeat-containing protein n=1 Tax=Violaceomyces palustris TaxID=1673888 RepID=A0ACD0NR09_9BASI|nr:ARM repeat-containing protein [Violaceomyces palustris]
MAGQAQQQPPKQRLRFKGKLYQKGQSTDALLKRVKTLRAELAEMEQDAVQVDSLDGVKVELVQANLMLHKDKAVKANVACCLADLLRLYAPDAPYTVNELKDIFQFFLHQLTLPNAGLSKPSGPQYPEYFYLLESLSNVKSVVLVCDTPNADEMMTDYFKAFFELTRPDMSKNVEICMADILVQLIDECVTLPNEVLEILLANFSTKAVKHTPAAHNMTVIVCGATKDRLQKHVAQYFTEVIVAAAEEEDPDAKMEAFQTAHSLIVQINRAVPSLLLNVIPQLEQELKAEDAQLRALATKMLGQMFAEKPSQKSGEGGDLAKKYASTWKAWLGRAYDKSVTLRTVWVEATKDLLISQPGLGGDLTQNLRDKLLEPDERVRAAMAKVLGELDYETLLHHVEKSVLLDLAERCKDRKLLVRQEALKSLGKMFHNAYPEIESHDPAATQQFAWIPSQIVKVVYTGGAEVSQSVAATVEEYILPPPSNSDDEVAWTNRLLLVVKFMEPDALKALLRLTNLILSKPSAYDAFVEACEAYNGGAGAEKDPAVRATLVMCIKRIASQCSEPQKAANDLHSFAKLNDARIYKLLRQSFDPQQDVKSLVKSRNEALRRVENASASIIETMKEFVRGGSSLILNRSSIPTLLKKLQQSRNDFSASQLAGASQFQQSQAGVSESQTQSQTMTMASVPDMEAYKASSKQLLEFVTKNRPQMLVAHVPELIKLLTDEGNPILAQVVLQALAAVARWSPDKVPMDRKLTDRVSKYARNGTRLQAKFASKLLSITGGLDNLGGTQSKRSTSSSTAGNATSIAYQALEEILEGLAKGLGKATGEQQVANLEALAQFFKHAPDASENVAASVVKVILAEILMKPWKGGDDEKTNTEDDWVDDDHLTSELQAKLLSLTVLTKRCQAFASTESANEMAKPIFRLLWAILSQGEARDLGTPAPAKARMRLAAALCVLKLARFQPYERSIGREYFNLAFALQDESFNVRNLLLNKLLTYLSRQKLTSRFVAMAFLVAFDPEEENRRMVEGYAAKMSSALPNAEMRLRLLDMSFVRFLHLLANHPDFSKETTDELAQFVRYVEFFLKCIANQQNVSLLFYLATRLKGVRDAESQGSSENLYALSELAQLVIKRRAAQSGWTIESYAGKITLPSDIFKPLPSREVQKELYERQHLPEELVKSLSEMVKPQRSQKVSEVDMKKRNTKRERERESNAAMRVIMSLLAHRYPCIL